MEDVPVTKTGFIAWVKTHGFALGAGLVIGAVLGRVVGAVFGL